MSRRPKPAARLVSRDLLERLSIEGGETQTEELHRDVSYLITSGTDLNEFSFGVSALRSLDVAAGAWRKELGAETDPKPPAETRPARMRELLGALRNNLTLAVDLVDALTAALPKDGAP